MTSLHGGVGYRCWSGWKSRSCCHIFPKIILSCRVLLGFAVLVTISLSQITATYLSIRSLQPIWVTDLQMSCRHLTVRHGTCITPLTMAAGRSTLLHHHGDVIKWKHFLRYWPFVRGIYRSPVNSPHKGPVTRSMSKRLNKQTRPRWIETQSLSLWRHCNARLALQYGYTFFIPKTIFLNCSSIYSDSIKRNLSIKESELTCV